MKDVDRQIYMLRRFYDGRHSNSRGQIKIAADPALSRQEQLIDFDICRQLHEQGLINWKGSSRGTYDGVGWITPAGITRIESVDVGAAPPAAHISIRGDVHFGDRTSQKIKMGVGKIEAPVMSHSAITKPSTPSIIGQLIATVRSWFAGS